MPVLHPIFMLIFLLLLGASYYEVFRSERKQPLFVVLAAILIIIAVGFRNGVGADYPVYKALFQGFSIYTGYDDVFDKALFRPTHEEIEWLFVLINKIIFDLGMPFFMVTFVMAVITISLKFTTIYKNVAYPALGCLFYFMPVMFFEDSGQMRQGLGIAICVASFKFIKERKLFYFLLCMYVALGFHKTSIVFLPAYWLVKVPLNKVRIFWILVISVLLSPFEVYTIFGGLFSSIAPDDVSNAYTGYLDDKYYGGALETGLNDIVKLCFIAILIRFDKEGCNEVWWYEYMRNLAVFGLAIFYLFRSNEIFAVRLPGAYMFFVTMFCMPNLVYATRDRYKQILYFGFIAYLVMMFFYFGKGNGYRGAFTSDRYKNVLW